MNHNGILTKLVKLNWCSLGIGAKTGNSKYKIPIWSHIFFKSVQIMALQNNSRRIMPYSFLQRLPKSGDATTTGFTLLFSPEPCFLVTSSAWAINPGICPTVSNNFQRWNQRPQALWWSAIGTLKLAPKRVLRSWAARRLRVAFVESLRKCGYSQDGVRISVNKKNGVFHQPSLKGTVQIFANNPSLIKMRNHDLMKQMDFTVQLLIKKLTETGSKNSRNRFDYSGRHQGKDKKRTF
ncbi:hypothetical protein OnM2_019081 [Erysiphe neolycopersici]|uniref:Uncharacterized protein n=1 Tax=Erysiphe neolycopersici TaxID=212602 RepID=A0A420I419_9PEZI|nr:hypothetical protein OnM2_019081 [Erysiphe neolycopersici]